jgi:hypothetical protein
MLLVIFLGETSRALCITAGSHGRQRPEYTGFDPQTGWQYPKLNWNPPWTPGVVDMWMERHKQDVANLEMASSHKACNVLVLGDSNTELFVRGSFNSGQHDPDELILRDDVQIFALGGDRFRDLGWRLFSGGGMSAIQRCSPRQIVMLMGTNDYQNPPGDISSIRDMTNLISQLSQALPSGAELIVHTILPRCCSYPDDGAFEMWRKMMHREFQAAISKQGKSSITLADCSSDLGNNEALYLDGVHLNADGLKVLGKCIHRRYNVQLLAEQPKPNIPQHPEVPMTIVQSIRGSPIKKMVTLIGDSVDRYAVDYVCKHFQEMNASLYFAQEPTHYFGRWPDTGKVSLQLSDELRSSKISSWKSWMVHVCHIPSLQATVASIFNIKGVSSNPPWWAQDTLESQMNMTFCVEGDPSTSCRNEGAGDFLRAPFRAIQKLYSDPSWQHTTVINSNFWDADREWLLKRSWAGVQDYVKDQWATDAGRFIDAVREFVPSGSQLYWRTASLPRDNTNMHLGAGSHVPEGSLGNRDIVELINKAGAEVAKAKRANLLDWSNLAREPRDYMDPLHPDGNKLVEPVAKLLTAGV